MNKYFADLHIHIGRSTANHPIKITASKSLTFENIVIDVKMRKGLDIIGVVDCASPPIITDIKKMINNKKLVLLDNGGYLYKDDLLVILGTEVEIVMPGYGAGHFLSYFKDIETIENFSQWLNKYITNIQLSTQVAKLTINELQHKVKDLDGLFVPAHIFTPHKGIYGNMVTKMADLADMNLVDAVELGLSADSIMAAHLPELQNVTLLSNSDAHSVQKIAREYNELVLTELSFANLQKALHNIDGNSVITNYGLNPKLGKYYRTHCNKCNFTANSEDVIHTTVCPKCNLQDITLGVFDRIIDISKTSVPVYQHRQQYKYQIPIDFIPKVGPKTLEKLYNNFQTEMNIIHNTSYEQLKTVVGSTTAELICQAREGTIELVVGGGGTYGKIKK